VVAVSLDKLTAVGFAAKVFFLVREAD
jgi:hypothetical protein